MSKRWSKCQSDGQTLVKTMVLAVLNFGNAICQVGVRAHGVELQRCPARRQAHGLQDELPNPLRLLLLRQQLSQLFSDVRFVLLWDPRRRFRHLPPSVSLALFLDQLWPQVEQPNTPVSSRPCVEFLLRNVCHSALRHRRRAEGSADLARIDW